MSPPITDVRSWSDLERERLLVWITERRLDPLTDAVSWLYRHDLPRFGHVADRLHWRLVDRIARGRLRHRRRAS